MLISVTVLLITGLLVFVVTLLGQRKLLHALLAQNENLPVKSMLVQPFQELLLGLVFTFAALFFARRLVGGTQALNLAVCVAAVVAVMSASGSMARFQAGLKKLELGAEQSARLQLWQRFCSLGILLLLEGLLGIACWQLGLF
ncbi:MAG: hypothetical protein GX946_02920 [Oligosphaeraceae bacterium]|nr:hypothetical protein [Oligosphaeraceae bacterium]